jgi:hypothetical protein
MIDRDLMHRLAGIVALLGTAASMLFHGALRPVHASLWAVAAELAFGLVTFILASFGLLLVLGGSRLRDGWKRTCEHAALQREQRTRTTGDFVNDAEAENRRIMAAAAIDPLAFAGGRAAIAAFLVMRAHQAAQEKGVGQAANEKREPGV